MNIDTLKFDSASSFPEPSGLFQDIVLGDTKKPNHCLNYHPTNNQMLKQVQHDILLQHDTLFQDDTVLQRDAIFQHYDITALCY